MKQTIRTFVAVEISSAVLERTEQLIQRLRTAPADVKWVEPHNRHMTLKFLGDVAVQETVRVCDAVGRTAEQVAPFELELCGTGAFPNARRPRTLWLGTGSGQEPLEALYQRLESALRKLGFKRENRQFHAHLTLGRVRHGGPQAAELVELIRQNADYSAGRTTVRELVTFSSQLGRSGPTYEALGRARLAGK